MNRRDQLPKESGVYQIRCTENGKIYIGSSIRIRSRISRHLMDLRRNVHSNQHLQNAFNKYGENKFEAIVLELCDKNKLCVTEQFYLDKLQPYDRLIGYNHYKKAYSPLGFTLTDEQKRKISIALTGRPVSEETRKKIGDRHRGKIMSLAAVEANRIWHTGIKQSEENIAKRAKEFTFIKDGVIYSGKNLKRFALEHGLTRGSLIHVLAGRRPHHKGFYKYIKKDLDSNNDLV